MNIVKHEQNGVLQITFKGKFTFQAHEAFREILDQIEQPEITRVAIDLRGVEFIDSAAMGMLLLARDETNKQHKSLVLEGAEGQVKKMFDMANFQNFFTLM